MIENLVLGFIIGLNAGVLLVLGLLTRGDFR